MKKKLLLSLFWITAHSLFAQNDTLGKYPFLYYDNMPELGSHDSMECPLALIHSITTFSNVIHDMDSLGSLLEYAKPMHTDDTLRIIGIAYTDDLPWRDGDSAQLNIYNTNMEILANAKSSFGVYWISANTYDSVNFVLLNVPHLVERPYNQPHYTESSVMLRLAFFDTPSYIDVVDSFYIGGKRTKSSWSSGLGENTSVDFCYLYERHDPPYIFPSHRFRMLVDKVWMDTTSPRSIPMLFPIIEPRCEVPDSLTVLMDSSGCLSASWDSLPLQSQWVVGYGLDGSTYVYDTVDACHWEHCGLDPNQNYSVCLRSRCTNIRSYAWSPWSHATTTDTTGVAGVAAADRQVGLSPNPATGRVQVTASCGMTEVAVYNATGEQVLRQPASGHSATLDTGRWPAGVYIVHVETPLGRAVKKLVVR